jgi:probable rRNA maturation factor
VSAADVLISIQDVSASSSVPPHDALQLWARAALAEEAVGELTLRLIGSAESEDLNSRYRGGRGPTNVLTFAAEPDLPLAPGEAPTLGDIVICAPLVAEEAQAQAKALEAHWAHIVIHGVLHLMGYDHETDEDAVTMESRERQILAGFDYPDPYADR